MPKLIFGFDEALGEWVVERIPHIRRVANLGLFTSIGVVSDKGDRLLAAAILHNYIEDYQGAELTFAADNAAWATKGVIRAILSVPFEQWQCRRLTMVTPHTNARAVKLIRGLGFKREGVVRHYFADGVHADIYGLTAKEYVQLSARLGRTVGEHRGQKFTKSPDAA